jgi:hypothetical protein
MNKKLSFQVEHLYTDSYFTVVRCRAALVISHCVLDFWFSTFVIAAAQACSYRDRHMQTLLLLQGNVRGKPSRSLSTARGA